LQKNFATELNTDLELASRAHQQVSPIVPATTGFVTISAKEAVGNCRALSSCTPRHKAVAVGKEYLGNATARLE